MKNKKNTLILLGVFTGTILLLGLLWLLASGIGLTDSDKTQTVSSSTISDLQLPALPTPSSSFAQSGRQQALQVQQETHLFVKETAQALLQQEIISLDHVVDWNKSLERADQFIRKSDYALAISHYQKIQQQVSRIAERERWKKESETLQAQLKDQLDQYEDVEDYAPVPYEIAEDAYHNGKKKYKSEDFQQAAALFQQGIEQLASIDDIITQYIEQALDTITAALVELDIKAAQKKLKEVLTIDPDHETALQAMEQQQYAQAIEAYERVLQTQPDLLTAKAGLEQARAALLEQKIRPLIEQAQKHFAESQYEESLKLLELAAELAPDDASIQQAIQEVRSAWKAHQLQLRLDQAFTHYENKDWQAAREIYLDILKDHPEHPEAQKGSTETSKQLAAEIKFRSAMRLSEKYAAAGAYPEAIQSFNAALSLMPAHTKLTTSQQAFRDNLEQQKQQQTITLKSDNRTWVSVIGSLPPERFSKKSLKLYPDVYKVIGKRKGFVDVNFELRVDATRPNQTITIKCTEKQ